MSTGLDRAEDEGSIVADIERSPVQRQRRLEVRRKMVQGLELEYRGWWHGEEVNVGTYFPTGRRE
jgi:hypothetical protein